MEARKRRCDNLRLRGLGLPFLVLALCACLVPCAEGQTVYGSLIGTVVDPSGAVVEGAKITATNVETNVQTTVMSNASGNYVMNQLTPGRYRISVEKSGFQTLVRENVQVTVALSTRLDPSLQVGDVTQSITVSEAPPGLQTDRAEVTSTLTREQLSGLPVFNRNFTDLTLLAPGATLNVFQHASQENPQQSTLVNTNGQQFSGTNYLLDGMNNNDVVLGLAMVNPPLESINETSIATSNYNPEFTQAGGAVVRAETRSGTNTLHGSLFEFLQNNALNARDPFSQGLHEPGTPAPPHRGIPAHRWNQFGGAVGGPAIKDKLFWFGDYQGTRRRFGASELLRVPTEAERGGDLSAFGVPIFQPSTGNANGGGRTPFSGGRIPESLISPPVRNLMAALPGPNLTPLNPADPNYSVSGVQRYDTNQFDIRVDHYLTDRARYFARYSYLGAEINAPGPFGLYGGTPFPAWGFTGASEARNQNFVAAGNYDVSPTLLTEVRFGYSRYRVKVNPLDIDQRLADQVGIPGLNIEGRPDTFGLPNLRINGTGGFLMGYSCNCPLDQREFIYDYVNNWTKQWGNHMFKAGATIEYAGNRRLPSDQHRAGVYEFDPGVTSSAPGAGGLGLASFMLGAPSHFQRFAQISTNQEDRQNRMFYFAQDTWRTTRNLTVTYGLRWDTWFPDTSLNAGQGGRYDVLDNKVRIPGVGGISSSAGAETQWRNVSPRLAIAYAIGQNTVVRTGYGISYFQGTFGWTFNNLAADIYPSIVNQDLRGASSFFPVFPLTTAPPAPVFPEIPSDGLLPLPDGISTPYIPANQKIPSVQQWNFTVERALPSGLNLSLGYVGNVGRHLNGGFNLNAAAPGPGDFNPRRPLYRQFGLTQGIFDKCDCTSSNYNALQIRGEKRFSHNYSLLASYTFSKTLDYGAFGTPTNQYDVSMDYGPSDFSRPHVFTLAHTVQLPFGPGQAKLHDATGLTRVLVEGWMFSGITTFASGRGFSPTLSSNASLNSDMSLRPDQVADPVSGIDQTRNMWFNPAAYAVPAAFTFGGASRNSIRGPNLASADWALSKAFTLTERTHLQFRWETFNLFNRTNLGLPNSAVDTGSAGLISSLASGPTLGMRRMQFGLRLSW